MSTGIAEKNKSIEATNGGLEKAASGNLWMRLASSPLVWIFITLMVFDFFISDFKPLRFVSVPGVVLRDQDPIDEKMSVLTSKMDRSNTLMLGCSMAASATANADIADSQQQMTEDVRRRYLRCHYFDRKVKEQFGLETNTLGLGIPGNMITCDLQVLNKAIEAGKAPKLVVLMVAPRAFIDNTRDESQYPVNAYFAWRFHDPNSVKDLRSAVDFALSSVWKFYGLRSDYETVARQATCSYFNRAATLYEALHTTSDTMSQNNKVTFSTLSEVYDAQKHASIPQQTSLNKFYELAYQPLNRKTFDKQMAALEQIASTCRSNKIDLLVIDMPLGKYNRKLLPAGFEAELREGIAMTCEKNDAKFLDLIDNTQFSKVDFTDTVHLTGDGAVKFWNIVLAELSKDQTYISRLKNTLQ